MKLWILLTALLLSCGCRDESSQQGYYSYNEFDSGVDASTDASTDAEPDRIVMGTTKLATGLYGGPVDFAMRSLTAVAWGDSLTQSGAWFQWMPTPWTMVDKGEDGDEWFNDIGDRCRADILASEPGDIAVLFGGTNDVRHVSWDAPTTLAEITSCVTAATGAGFVVVVVMPPPIYEPDEGPEDFVTEMTEYRNALFAEFLPRNDVVLADIYTAFKADPNPQSLYEQSDTSNDGVHPWGQNPNFRGRILEAGIITTAAVAAMRSL